FHFARADPESGRLDHRVAAPDKKDEPILVSLYEITGVANFFSVLEFGGYKRMRSQDLSRQLRFAPVPQRYRRSTMNQFTDFARLARLTVLVHNEDLGVRNCLTDRGRAAVEFLRR